MQSQSKRAVTRTKASAGANGQANPKKMAKPGGTPAQSTTPARSTSSAPRILVVDDDLRSREVVAFSLGSEGFDVTTAENGDRALNLARRTPFDLILLDVNMPEISGYEVLHALRKIPSRVDTPVLMLTARGFEPEGMVQEALGDASGHITKPFSQAVLTESVRGILASDAEDHRSRRAMRRRAADVYRTVIDLRAQAGSNEDAEPPPTTRFRRRVKS